MGDSGSMLIGLVLAAGAISITGQVDPDAMKLTSPAVEREATVHCDGAGLHPAAAAADDHRDPGRRPGAGDRAAHLERPVAVRRRPRPSAPPAAGDRPLAQPGRADHVLLVGADRLRRGRLLGATRVQPVDRAGRSSRSARWAWSLLLLPRFTPARPALGGGASCRRATAAGAGAGEAPARRRRRSRSPGGAGGRPSGQARPVVAESPASTERPRSAPVRGCPDDGTKPTTAALTIRAPNGSLPDKVGRRLAHTRRFTLMCDRRAHLLGKDLIK